LGVGQRLYDGRLYDGRLYDFTTDDAFRRNLAAEGEIDAIFDAQDAKYLKQIVELQDEKKRFQIKLARLLKSSGATVDEIRNETGMDPESLT